MLDRFNILPVARDHFRSIVKFPTDRPDRLSKFVLYALPLIAGGVVIWQRYRIEEPTALVPATSLLAGTFFAAVGQLISIRARVADSVHLSGNKRLRAHFRESVSGMLLAALAALFVSLALGALSLMPSSSYSKPVRWAAIGLSAAALSMLLYMVLLFVGSARRLYTSYLEAFENGLPLPRRVRKRGSDSDSGPDSDLDIEATSAARPDRVDV